MRCCHRLDEPGVDAVGDDQPARRPCSAGRWRRTRLARCSSTACARSASSSTTSGFLPPISSCTFFRLARALLGNALAHASRAGEADGVDAGVVDQRVTDDAAAAHDQVEHARRHAAAADDLGQRPGAAGHQVGRLEHHAVAVGQRRGDLPGRNGDGEVPGRDQADHAHRFAGDFDADARAYRGHDFTSQAQALAGEELEDVAGARDLANAFGHGLAFFTGQQGAEFFTPGQDFGADLVQRIGSGLDVAGRPGGEGGLGGLDRGIELRGIGLGVVADDVGNIGRIDVGGVLGTRNPLAVDEVVVFLSCHGDRSLVF